MAKDIEVSSKSNILCCSSCAKRLQKEITASIISGTCYYCDTPTKDGGLEIITEGGLRLKKLEV